MKKIHLHIISLVAIFAFISCRNNKVQPPKDLISKDKMVEVIAEIELTQALIKLKLANQDTINKQQLFNQVYDEFNISEEQFNNSLTYYSKVPRDLMLIYEEVVTKLSQKQEIEK